MTKSIVTSLLVMSYMICMGQPKVKNYSDFDIFEKEYLLNKSDDSTYVINFWATWCAPCVKELPYFSTLEKNYAEKKVKFLYVSLDFAHQIESKLIPFIEERGMTKNTVILSDGNTNKWINKVSEEWSGAIPFTMIMKNDQKKLIFNAVHSYEELEEHFLKIFN